MRQLDRQIDRLRFLASLSDVITIARGPKPTAALKELGLTPTHRTSEPHTWREVLALVDRHVALANQVVAMQEYGEPNTSLVAGLEARGARVVALKVYRWDLPEDTAPLANLVLAIAAGEIDVLLLTSAIKRSTCCEWPGNSLTEIYRRSLRGTGSPRSGGHQRDARRTVDRSKPEHPQIGHLNGGGRAVSGAERQNSRSRRSWKPHR
jgi:hypothetical protein